MTDLKKIVADFYVQFPDEEACVEFIRSTRENLGLYHPQGDPSHYVWNKKRRHWRCSKTGYRLTLKKATCMENSKIPIDKWLLLIYFLTMVKRPIAMTTIRKVLGFRKYETVYYMCQKARQVMDGVIFCEYEFDYIDDIRGSSTKCETKPAPGKGEKDTRKVILMHRDKTKKPVQSELDFYLIAQGKKYCFNDLTSPEEMRHRYRYIKILTNRHLQYMHLWEEHHPTPVKPEERKLFRKLLHKLYNIHQRVSSWHLQLYLSEFAYRRNFESSGDLFQTFIKHCF